MVITLLDLYTSFLSHRGVVNKRMKRVWKSKLPMKLKVFLWLAFHDRLQTGVELKKRKWKRDQHCRLCGVPETRDHLFFECVMAKFVWSYFKEALGWDRIPTNLQDLFDTWLPFGCNSYMLKLFLLSVVLWALWTSRNKRAIEKKFVPCPFDILFKIKFFVQK